MQFDADDIADFFAAAESESVVVKFNGVAVKSIQAIYRHTTEFTGQGNELRILPSILCAVSDLEDVTRSHTLLVRGVDYRQFQAPLPDNAGFARIGLVK